MYKVAVYGTLKKGKHNHHLIDKLGCTFLGNAKNIEAFFNDEQIPVEIIEKANKFNSARRLMETNNGVDTYLQYSLDIAKTKYVNDSKITRLLKVYHYHI